MGELKGHNIMRRFSIEDCNRLIDKEEITDPKEIAMFETQADNLPKPSATIAQSIPFPEETEVKGFRRTIDN
ncbi:hypothetical protein CHS0354_037719 [Potamilus streckersoni]|uniref:Uncharacterized protein n=1 Tax=Potamilus streckersoni TaxID=2493646 RepID=A0AAE0T0Q3_9BIVA|nr:hypothetical protein CHS0354_037719 [Potamilus streckersoni]